MALQLGALRDALRAAKVPDELAAKAAEELAGYDNRLGGIERQLIELRAHVDQRFSEFRAYVDQRFAEVDQRFIELRAYVDQQFERMNGRMNLLTWMMGSLGTVIVGLLVAIFLKLFVH